MRGGEKWTLNRIEAKTIEIFSLSREDVAPLKKRNSFRLGLIAKGLGHSRYSRAHVFLDCRNQEVFRIFFLQKTGGGEKTSLLPVGFCVMLSVALPLDALGAARRQAVGHIPGKGVRLCVLRSISDGSPLRSS